MHILVSGAGGSVGSALVRSLAAGGHTVSRLVRRAPRGPGEFRWDPARDQVDMAAFSQCEAVVHLAGASIAGGRWSRTRKAVILASRRDGTRVIANAVAAAQPAPRTFISASGVGIYGDRGDETLDESSAPGAGFLAEVAQVWEAAARPAARIGARVVHMRFGLILDRRGGALPRLVLPFRLGVGGPLGTGHQWVSWISMADAVGAIGFALSRNDMRGPVNVVSPQPLRQEDLARALARALHRPGFFRVPGWVIRALLGGMGEELLLASQRVVPAQLVASGYTFRHPTIDEALRAVL